MSISLKRKKIFQKEKRYSFVFRSAFQISRKKFSCHVHFKWGIFFSDYIKIYLIYLWRTFLLFYSQDEYDSYMSYLLDTQKPSQHKVLYHHIDSLSDNLSSSDKLKDEEKRVETLEKEARHLLEENAR